MLQDTPDIDQIIIYDEELKHRSLYGKLKLILELKKQNFDTAISFHRSATRMFLAYLAGIKQRIGYYTRKRFWLLTKALPMPQPEPHRVEYFLDIIRALGMDTKSKDYTFFISQDNIDRANAILKNVGILEEDSFFVINPAGNWPPKRWPAKKYAQLCQELKQQYGKSIVITGAEADVPLAEEIIGESRYTAVSLCGKTNLKELAAVMKRACLVVTNDSGPLHIAVSQKTPVVALFGPTSPKITGPYGDCEYAIIHKWFDCPIPCYRKCNDYRCMEAIAVSDVAGAVEKLMCKGGRR
jgi:lipopolysaccharide heptosyltransferase II